MLKKISYSLLASVPVALLAFSTGPPIRRTGAPVDGGQNCSVCHRNLGVANSDPAGSVKIEAGAYSPGVTQTIKVTVQHPEAMRWGFQMTARMISDETKQAGSFAPNDVVRVRCDVTGVDGPCGGAVEFAEHRDAPFTDKGAGFTFQVDWTPPMTDSGDIVFYAAGNAANGDRNLTGDHIYTTARTITPAACSLGGKPNITGVGNGASFQSAIDPGSIVSIFGQNFAAPNTSRGVIKADLTDNTFPRQLGCVAVEINGKRLALMYVGPNQINAQAPSPLPAGPVDVKVILNPDRGNQSASDTAKAQVVSFAPALFTYNGRSVAAQFAGTANAVANPDVVPGGKPAKPGDFVTIWGTGFGPTDPPMQPGDVAQGMPKIVSAFTVTIGTATLTPSDINYAGLSPGSIAGLYQFNVKIPLGTPDGDIPVVIQMGGAKTQNNVTLPVKNGTP